MSAPKRGVTELAPSRILIYGQRARSANQVEVSRFVGNQAGNQQPGDYRGGDCPAGGRGAETNRGPLLKIAQVFVIQQPNSRECHCRYLANIFSK